jgi:hypothetical protein
MSSSRRTRGCPRHPCITCGIGHPRSRHATGPGPFGTESAPRAGPTRPRIAMNSSARASRPIRIDSDRPSWKAWLSGHSCQASRALARGQGSPEATSEASMPLTPSSARDTRAMDVLTRHPAPGAWQLRSRCFGRHSRDRHSQVVRSLPRRSSCIAAARRQPPSRVGPTGDPAPG